MASMAHSERRKQLGRCVSEAALNSRSPADRSARVPIEQLTVAVREGDEAIGNYPRCTRGMCRQLKREVTRRPEEQRGKAMGGKLFALLAALAEKMESPGIPTQTR